jgi:surfactin synthase thioesterase subunit
MKPSIRLFCIPFAGGNIYSYRQLCRHLHKDIVPQPVELPGRGKRLKEPLLTNIAEMTDDILQQIGATDHKTAT